MFLGLRSHILPVPDLDAARDWYRTILGVEPYYDVPPYVGFDVGGYEIGLFAAGDPDDGPKTYWGVDDVDARLAALLEAGATLDEPVTDVGGGIRMASVLDPSGFILGLIEHPGFEVQPVESAGPGR